jgi:hypothetical protein
MILTWQSKHKKNTTFSIEIISQPLYMVCRIWCISMGDAARGNLSENPGLSRSGKWERTPSPKHWEKEVRHPGSDGQ